MIDTDEVLRAAQEIFEKQRQNPVQNESADEEESDSYASEEESSSEDGNMSFTSGESQGDQAALFNLIMGSSEM